MATRAGTFDYRDRQDRSFARSYFRRAGDCLVSSVGLGTRPGAPTAAVDDAYREAVGAALDAGANVVLTAPADRHQRSQRAVGRALSETTVPREAVFLAAGAGRIPFDGDRPEDPAGYVRRTYLDPGLVAPADLAHGSHALAPGFVADQVDRSLRNLGVDRVDAMLVESPEVHLDERPLETVLDRLEDVFTLLERRVERGDVGGYGVAAQDGLRVGRDHGRHLPLPAVVRRARRAADRAGRDRTGLRYLVTPFNALAAGAFTVAAHEGPAGDQSALWFAAEAGLDVLVTAPLAGGELARPGALPAGVAERLEGETPAQRALNFARSAPGVATAVAGSRTAAHVRENIAAGEHPPLGAEAFDAAFE